MQHRLTLRRTRSMVRKVTTLFVFAATLTSSAVVRTSSSSFIESPPAARHAVDEVLNNDSLSHVRTLISRSSSSLNTNTALAFVSYPFAEQQILHQLLSSEKTVRQQAVRQLKTLRPQALLRLLNINGVGVAACLLEYRLLEIHPWSKKASRRTSAQLAAGELVSRFRRLAEEETSISSSTGAAPISDFLRPFLDSYREEVRSRLRAEAASGSEKDLEKYSHERLNLELTRKALVQALAEVAELTDVEYLLALASDESFCFGKELRFSQAFACHLPKGLGFEPLVIEKLLSAFRAESDLSLRLDIVRGLTIYVEHAPLRDLLSFDVVSNLMVGVAEGIANLPDDNLENMLVGEATKKILPLALKRALWFFSADSSSQQIPPPTETELNSLVQKLVFALGKRIEAGNVDRVHEDSGACSAAVCMVEISKVLLGSCSRVSFHPDLVMRIADLLAVRSEGKFTKTTLRGSFALWAQFAVAVLEASSSR